ncbi:MAG: class I tRNA ligase family protein, partial [Thermoguttaceae bacterium]|nr:class I tRNA ligase family protein [Thermoguttaceae bacterium]
ETIADGQLTAETLRGAEGYRPVAQRGELDRWIISELNSTIKFVTERLDAFDHFAACGKINALVDSLSNWYVRRSRDRFWASGQSAEKFDAYWTLYEVLLTCSKLIAPFVPFIAERIYLALTGRFGGAVRESVHLCGYPVADESLIDTALSQRMAAVREIVSLGRNARMGARLKVRQPLAGIEVVLANPAQKQELLDQVELMKEELNVKSIEFIDSADRYISYSVVPDFKKLGPKLGRMLPAVKAALGKSDGAALLAEMNRDGKITLDIDGTCVELSSEEVQIRLTAKEGFAAAQGTVGVVVLSTELTEELLTEGRARELVRMIQDRRKELQCEYTDRIRVGIETASAAVLEAYRAFAETIQAETLAVETVCGKLDGVAGSEGKIDGEPVTVYVATVKN